MARVQMVEQPRTKRVSRKPQHPFQLRDVHPWQIQPMFIAPVLPGETMKNMNLQARVVSDPLANRLIGWWCEYYFFYVKLAHLGSDFTSMMVDPEKDMSSYDDATSAADYHLNGTPSPAINYVDRCRDVVVQHYFRNEGEAVNDHLINSVPIAQLGRMDWTDSFGLQSDIDEGNNDIDYSSNTDGDMSTTVTASEIAQYQETYEFLKQNNIVDMSYEDYLATFGVSVAKEDVQKPELVRYIREWTYPTNTIDSSDGSATTAASWSIQGRADKDRFFKEPGFLVGYQVIRPKVYSADQRSSITSLLTSARDWLPAMLSGDAWSSIRRVDASAPPFGSQVPNDWLFDIKDLFLYGEQFLNFDPSATNDKGCINIDPSNRYRYGNQTAAESLFTDTVTNHYIDTDGIVTLNILGRQVDTTPNYIGA